MSLKHAGMHACFKNKTRTTQTIDPNCIKNINLKKNDAEISSRILKEINNRIDYMIDVGLGYLTLNRKANTLSGGETQRINLASSLGSSLVGSTYILDEPSIGLHSRDNENLIKILKNLKVKKMILVTKSKKKVIGLEGYNLSITKQEIL